MERKFTMTKILKVLVSVSCFLAIAGCTVICLYEVYNSYISSDPRNIETYHQAAINRSVNGTGKATAEVASPDTAGHDKASPDSAATGFDDIAESIGDLTRKAVTGLFGFGDDELKE